MAAAAVHSLAALPARPNRPLPTLRSSSSSSKPAPARRLASAAAAALLAGGAAVALAAAAPSHALASTLPVLQEPANALSLPTWAIHVSSVVEWILAMALVWEYGEKSGFQQWKGLSWGMILVAIQAALTVIGNITMAIAAFRIYEASQKGPSSS